MPVILKITSATHLRMGYLLDPLLSHQSISDCHHAVELKLRVQQGVLFPIKRKENRKSKYKNSIHDDIFGLFDLNDSLRSD